MVIGKHTLLYLIETDHPLWLTKDIMAYVGGKDLIQCIDWIRSGRNCLYVKNKAPSNKLNRFIFLSGRYNIFGARKRKY